MRISIPTPFAIWYSTTYTVLFCILLLFLAVTPADTIFQSIRSKELQKLFVIGGVYCLTFLITLLIYSTRLYTNRSVLQAIPKPYVPIEDGEVGKLVRRMIVKALRRSAIIAWDSHPRDVREDAHEEGEDAGSHHLALRRRGHTNTSTVIPVSAASPPWGHVSHCGWASPSSADLPNLQYGKVVAELPNLIEAKAVSLAPPDPAVDDQLRIQGTTPMLPDAQIVALLQRPRTMGLRDYLGQLASYGLINPPSLATKFLAQYEYARFSTHSLTETEFRNLMAIFAGILNSMTELDPELIEAARAESDYSDSSSFSSSLDSSSSSTRSALRYQTPRLKSRAGYFDMNSTSSHHDGSESPQTVRTAPSRQRNANSGIFTLPRTPSEMSVGSGSVRIRSTARSPSTILPNSSSSSLRSTRSVVRLRSAVREGEPPYQYHFDDG